MLMKTFPSLLKEVHACNACADHLALPPKPVIQVHPSAKMLIIAQAPGIRARTSGLPFDDASGNRLRAWLGIDRSIFYNEKKIALMPMGFCYPGTNKNGDLPPCSACAPLWHTRLLPYLKNVTLTLLVGGYAQQFYLKTTSVTQAVQNWSSYFPKIIPLPHPSWHNNKWIKNNPWFEEQLLPKLKSQVAKIIETNQIISK
jgi:uracil-DNA glycosylase